MAEEKIGIGRALWRLISFWRIRKALGLVRAADEQFTGSVQGISDAFDIQQDKLVRQYRDLRDAIAQVESVVEQKRDRLEKLNAEEEELLQKREGALVKAEQSEDAGDTASLEKHTSAFERFENRIQEIDAEQVKLENEIKEISKSMEKYMLQLTAMQAEIEKLPVQKSEAIAEFISSKRIIELNERLSGIQSSIDRGPIDAVFKANRELSARAKISEKLAGTDVKLQDQEYSLAGRGSTAREKMKQVMAARKAERDAKSGKQPVKEKEKAKDDRPEI